MVQETRPPLARDWRQERTSGIVAIAASTIVTTALWSAIFLIPPPLPGMESLAARMLFALKCYCLAVLFTLVMGIEAVAHERLQSPAFDPLANHHTRRLQVNQRYLQNTLEQSVIFAAALFGLAAYSPTGQAMKAVLATAVVWTLGRFAFWAGYHRSAAMRGLGAPGAMASLLALIYVGARIGNEAMGRAGSASVLVSFLAFEILLFRSTRESPRPQPSRKPRRVQR